MSNIRPLRNSSQAVSLGIDYERQPLDAWLQEAMSEVREDRPCTRISLMHMRGPDDGREVWTAVVNGKKPAELADMFERKARSTAQDLGFTGSGVQMFELWAFYGDNGVHEAWHPMPVRSKIARDGFGSEGPAGLGPDAQRMRQSEAIFGQMFAKQSHLDAQHAGLITFLGNSLLSAMESNSRLVRENAENLRTMQDRAHEYKMNEIRAIQDAAWKEKLLSFAPPLANVAFGKEIFPQSTADSAMFVSMVEGMADENPMILQMFVDSFKEKPEVHGVLASRVAEILKTKSDREDAREKAINAIPQVSDPEEDAAGGKVLKLVEGSK